MIISLSSFSLEINSLLDFDKLFKLSFLFPFFSDEASAIWLINLF